MTEGMLHPAAEELEAYVDGSLPDAERAVLESHVNSCPRCAAEVDEWRALFAALSSLPHLDPTPGFADRVMAGVQIRRPLSIKVAELLRRLLPTSTTGWVLVTALLALPVLGTAGILARLPAQPWLTPENIWLFIRARAADAVLSLAGRAGMAVLESNTASVLIQWGQGVLSRVGTAELGMAAAGFAVLAALSAWILYQNLFGTSTRGKPHATYPI